jgi:adenylate cyclase
MERKLSAILAADVVAYSSLMEKDEAGTLDLLKQHRRDVFDPEVARHGGRIVKLIGDGTLVEFTSAVAAVNCAISIQSTLTEGNDWRITLRIGVNLGDVIVDGDDLYGNGINVAARLQEIAEPGGICISGTVFDQIDSNIGQVFIDFGNHSVKNISKLVRVYGNFERQDKSLPEDSTRPFFDNSQEKLTSITGGCLCREVRFRIKKPSIDTNYCHCRMCQQFSGAPVIAASTFPKDAVEFTRGNPKYYKTTHEHTLFYKSSLIAERGFCPTCGSGLVYRPLVQRWSDWIAIFTASLDNPEEFGPRWHLGIESQMPWLNIQDDLSRVRCKDSPGLVTAWESVGLNVP